MHVDAQASQCAPILNEACAFHPCRALDMTPFQGRLLHVLPAKRKPGEEAAENKPEQQVITSMAVCWFLGLLCFPQDVCFFCNLTGRLCYMLHAHSRLLAMY